MCRKCGKAFARKVIGEPMRRTVARFGTAFVDMISSIRGLQKTTSRPLATVISIVFPYIAQVCD